MKNIIIGIAGGTGSGKSTFTRKLKKEFKDDVAVLYHDNYYRDQSDIPLEVRKKTNYDHPDAMETELLVQQLMELKEGKAIECPVYDYTLHTRSNQVERVEPKKVILLEGILVLADERLRNLMDIKVYVEADADERILRRLIRSRISFIAYNQSTVKQLTSQFSSPHMVGKRNAFGVCFFC